MKEKIEVNLSNKSYPIYFLNSDAKLQECINRIKDEKKKSFLITDESIYSIYSHYIKKLGIEEENVYKIPSGESSKSIQQFELIISFLINRSANRDSVIFAFGGGVVGDLAGFVAASFLRGIDFYQIPTTLLAMVDSSVGGKTGINIKEGKNLVGAFWQPKAVFIDLKFLNSLPINEFQAGMAEVIKYGMITDVMLLELIETNSKISPNSKDLTQILIKCCEIKSKIVAKDEKETCKKDGRALLNLGHTFGHAIENVSGYGKYLHGEAISIGLYLACLLSERLGTEFSENDTQRIVKILCAHSLPIKLKSPLKIDSLNKAISHDKKNNSDGIKFVAMNKIGEAKTYKNIEKEIIISLWDKVGAIL